MPQAQKEPLRSLTEQEEKRGGGQVTVEALLEHQTAEAQTHVQQALNERRPLGTTCLVNWAHYKAVRVTARIIVQREEAPRLSDSESSSACTRPLIPCLHKFSSTGWLFGQALRASHVYDVALAEPGVRWVDQVRLVVDEVPEGNVAAMAADTTQQRTWYVGSGNTLFRSLNDGEGWEPAGRFQDEEITGVMVHPGW